MMMNNVRYEYEKCMIPPLIWAKFGYKIYQVSGFPKIVHIFILLIPTEQL